MYENTQIVGEEFDPDQHAYFLQASDILSTFPAINQSSMGWVSKQDWERYPKGHIRKGELLVEVKGKAEKVAIVPEDFPDNVLVTGTLYKMLIDEEQINRYYVLVYLLSQIGRDFRDRSKTNLLVSYVSKDELYNIPVPVASEAIQSEIAAMYLNAQAAYRRSNILYAEAEALLLHELGLDKLDLSHELTYEGMFGSAWAVGRLDAEYFQPKYEHLIDLINSTGQAVRLGDWLNRPIRRGTQPDYAETGDVVVINSQHVGKTHIELDDNRITRRDLAHSRAWVKPYDVLLNSTGYITIGRCQALLDNVAAVVDGHVSIIETKTGLDPVYLSLFLNTLPGQLQTERNWTGSSGQIELRAEAISNYTVWCPNETLQLDIRKMVVDAHRARIEAKRLLEEAKQRVVAMILGM